MPGAMQCYCFVYRPVACKLQLAVRKRVEFVLRPSCLVILCEQTARVLRQVLSPKCVLCVEAVETSAGWKH